MGRTRPRSVISPVIATFCPDRDARQRGDQRRGHRHARARPRPWAQRPPARGCGYRAFYKIPGRCQIQPHARHIGFRRAGFPLITSPRLPVNSSTRSRHGRRFDLQRVAADDGIRQPVDNADFRLLARLFVMEARCAEFFERFLRHGDGLDVFVDHLHRALADDLADGALQARARLQRIAANQAAHHLVADTDAFRRQPVLLDLPGQQVPLGDIQLSSSV